MGRSRLYAGIRTGAGGCPGVIDNHGHLYLDPAGSLKGCYGLEKEIEDVLSILDSSGIDRAVVFSTAPPFVRSNDRIISALDIAGDRLIGYATLTLDAPRFMTHELERCSARGLKGLKLHSAYGDDFLNPAWGDAWDFCAEKGWPVIIHGMLPSLARDNPRTAFIHAHGIEAIFREEAREAMNDLGNYYWDTSATMTLMGAVEKAVSLFGSEKLLFGSDLPLNNPALRMGAVLAAKISDKDLENILGANITRLLGLEAAAVEEDRA